MPRPVLTPMSVDLSVYVLAAATGESLRLQLDEEGVHLRGNELLPKMMLTMQNLSSPQPWRINMPNSNLLAA